MTQDVVEVGGVDAPVLHLVGAKSGRLVSTVPLSSTTSAEGQLFLCSGISSPAVHRRHRRGLRTPRSDRIAHQPSLHVLITRLYSNLGIDSSPENHRQRTC